MIKPMYFVLVSVIGKVIICVIFYIFCNLTVETGYIVHCWVRRNSGVHGLVVTVQSDRQPQYVDDRVEAFLHHMNVSYLKYIVINLIVSIRFLFLHYQSIKKMLCGLCFIS